MNSAALPAPPSAPRGQPEAAARRLAAAFAASFALHAAILAGAPPGRLPDPTPEAAPRLDARLAPPPAERLAEGLLKDTLARDARPAPAAPPPAAPPAAPRPATAQAARFEVEAQAQRKLARQLFYPPEAVARGLEGEVRVLLTLDAAGRVAEVEIAAGSGHAILDAAALAAVRSLGRIADAGPAELILPVVFRLR